MSQRAARGLLLSLTLLATSALATVVISESVEEMTRAAPLIVRGTARRSMTAFDAGERRIWTWTEVVVTEALKGRAPATVLVKQPGGEFGGLGQHVSGTARFREGEDCVLFLEPATDERDAYVVRGLAAGKVSFAPRLGQTVALRELSGLAFARAGRRDAIRPVDDGEVLGTPDAFLARVRAATGGAR